MYHTLRAKIAVSVATALTILAVSTAASAFNLRVPQIVFNSASLQAYLTGQGESINVLTDQMDAQSWTVSASGNSVFTLMVEFAGNANGNTLGVYNSDDAAPALFMVFPGIAGPGWHALISFNGALLTVYLFDAANALQGMTVYNGVHPNSFGFYLQGPGGTFYSQDFRNGNQAQMLTYQGTGNNFGEWWMCFEDTPLLASDADFDDVVVILESVVPLKTVPATLGQVKSLYRNN